MSGGRSIARRVARAMAATAVLAALLSAVLATAIAWRFMLDREDARLRAAARTLDLEVPASMAEAAARAHADEEQVEVAVAGMRIALYRGGRFVGGDATLRPSAAEGCRSVEPRWRRCRMTLATGAVEVAGDLSSAYAQRSLLLGASMLAVALAGLAGLGLSGAVSARIVRPLQRLREELASVDADAPGRALRGERDGYAETDALRAVLGEMLARLDRALAQSRHFAANAAHELRTPLGTMRAELELSAEADGVPEEVEGAVRRVLRTLGGLTALVERLLILVALDESPRGAQEAVALADVVEEVLAALDPSVRGRVRASVDDAVHVRGDAVLLRTMLENVVGNALKFALAGEVTLSVVEEGDAAVVVVEDRGPGVAAEDRRRVFDAFHRSADARAGAVRGHGVGLALVARIAAVHGGSAAFADVPEGARLVVTLPRWAPREESSGPLGCRLGWPDTVASTMHRLAPVALLALGCASSPYDHAWVSRDLARRTGHAVGPQRPTEAPSVPRGVSLDDGLTAEETVALALWNNPRFHGDLAQLGFSRADLEEAGLLPNPLLTLMLPIGAHPLSFRVQAPLEALWQRGRRVAAAQRDVERVARSLVQTGLDLARDARLAHADLDLAEERLRVRTAADETLAAIIEITRLRAAAGDVGDAELESARAEALTARDAFLRAQADAQIARVAFRAVVGFAADPRPLRAVAAPPDEAPAEPLADVVRFARSARPDLRAAELAVEAAAARAGWERTRIISFTAALDAVTLNPIDGLALGPGIIAPIPIFNFNQGAIGRAEAEIEQASWRAIALRQQVVTDVSQAQAQLAQARESLARWRAEVLPSLERSVQFGTEQFTAGEASYLAVLDATRRAIDGRLRVAELEADVRRALAQRDRSAGGTPR